MFDHFQREPEAIAKFFAAAEMINRHRKWWYEDRANNLEAYSKEFHDYVKSQVLPE